MGELTAEGVGHVITVLNNRLRADPFELRHLDEQRADALLRNFHDRILPETAAVRSNRHVVLTGRRGAGKTSTMMRAFLELWREGHVCIWVDVQTHRRESAHGVTARMVAEILGTLVSGVPEHRRYTSLRNEISDLKLSYLDVAKIKVVTTVGVTAVRDDATSRSTSRSAAVGLVAERSGLEAMGKVAAAKSRSVDNHETITESLSFDIDPWDRLEDLLDRAREVLASHSKRVVDGDAVFIFLDDFYYIPKSDQPLVADYLHRLTKNLNVWLKIGAVRHRLKLFDAGDPPIGIEDPHDATFVTLDVSLDRFEDSKAFLEQIVRGICAEVGLTVPDIVSEAARPRLVLAAGGVPRDYLYLLTTSLERHIRAPVLARVSTETVNDVAPALLEQKYQDLTKDVDTSQRGNLQHRLADIHNFCIKDRKANVFVVPSEVLTSEDWGQEILALAELRLLHYVGSVTLKSSQKQYVGVRYSAFCLDLSAYAGTRVRSIRQIEFWTANGKQQLRLLEYVYTPTPTPDGQSMPQPPTIDQDQASLF